MSLEYKDELPSADDIFDLYSRLQWIDFLKIDKHQLLEAMKGSYYSVYVYDDGQLVGTARVVSDGVINALLCGLGVREEWRHRGIGTEITKRLCDYCRKNHLHIQFFCEDHLTGYYEKMGFSRFASGMMAD